jgi:ammonia channel protein AmtB
MFAGMTENIIWYAIIVGIMATIVLVMMVLKRRQRKKAVQRANLVPQHYEEGYYGALADSVHPNDAVQPSSHTEGYGQDEYSQQGAYVDSHPRA